MAAYNKEILELYILIDSKDAQLSEIEVKLSEKHFEGV
jgi:hypothetical protein